MIPKEGSFVTLKAIRTLNDKIGFSAEDLVTFDIKEDNGLVTWNERGNETTDINLCDAEAEILRKELRTKNDTESLTMDMFSIYEKFMC